jgi:hypothetical protein
MDKIELQLAQVGELLGVDTTALQQTFVADGKPLEGDAVFAKVKDLMQAERNRIHTEGAAKGKRERMSEFETNIRQKFGYEGTQQGESLIEAIFSSKDSELQQLKALAEANKGKKIEQFTAEEAESFIKNHPFFQTKISEFQTKTTEWEQKYTQFEQQQKAEKIDNLLKDKALSVLDSLNPVIQGDAAVQSYQKQAFLNLLKGSVNFALGENGALQVVDKQGNPLKDDRTFKDISIEDLVKQEAAKMFVFQQQDPKGSGGNGGTAGSVAVPKNQEEFNAAIANAKTVTERQAIRAAYGIT